MKNKIRLIIGIILFILFLTGITAYIYIPNKARSETTNSIPTVFIHGYKGTAKSFNTMLNRFEKNGWGKKGLVYFISSNGRILDYKVNGAQADQMFVQIILQNNRANFSDSARWLSDALRHLKENYNVNTVNLVGHSMGELFPFITCSNIIRKTILMFDDLLQSEVHLMGFIIRNILKSIKMQLQMI